MILTIPKRAIAILLALAVIAAATVAAVKAEPQTVRLPVLMYHHLSEKSRSWGAYVISPEQFRNDLIYLRDQGYQTITAAQLVLFAAGKAELPEKPVLITFDDGYESFYAYAFPILKELEMSAVLSVIGTYTEQYSNAIDHNVQYAHVTWDEIAEMANTGLVEIGNHTYNLHTLKDRKGCRIKQGENEDAYRKMLADDLQMLQDKVKEVTGQEPIVFTYPYGSICSQGCELVRQMGFPISLGCEEKINRLTPGDPDSLQTLKRFNRAYGKSSEAFLSPILNQ